MERSLKQASAGLPLSRLAMEKGHVAISSRPRGKTRAANKKGGRWKKGGKTQPFGGSDLVLELMHLPGAKRGKSGVSPQNKEKKSAVRKVGKEEKSLKQREARGKGRGGIVA